MATTKKTKKIKKAKPLTTQQRLTFLEESINVVVSTLADLQDRFEKVEATDFDEETHWLPSPVSITADQAKSMSDEGGWLMAWHESGDLFIGNLSRSPSAEGNGCWHDPKGNEVHGPVGDKYAGTD